MKIIRHDAYIAKRKRNSKLFALLGFLMLTGRINWKYGATVVLGLFILFGAASIVGGIRSVAGG